MKTQELKSERVRNNMTQREVAEKIGLSEAGYWHKENGKKEFNRQEIERLIDLFNLSNDRTYEIFFKN